MAKTSKSYCFPSNKDVVPVFSPYNGFARDFITKYDKTKCRPYYLNGRTFGEGCLIWIPIIFGSNAFGCNIDPGETNFDSSFQVSLCKDLKASILSEGSSCRIPKCFLDYYQAKLLAKKKLEPGFVIVCSGGKFNVLCDSFYSPGYNNVDYVAKVFNAELCRLENRNCWSPLMAQIDDAHLLFGIRYTKGKELNWEKTVDAVKSPEYYGDDDAELYSDVYSKLDDQPTDDDDDDDYDGDDRDDK